MVNNIGFLMNAEHKKVISFGLKSNFKIFISCANEKKKLCLIEYKFKALSYSTQLTMKYLLLIKLKML